MSFGVIFTPAGPIAPSYEDILAYLRQQARSIFGSDLYLDSDSQDGQLLAVFATGIKQSNDAAVAAYNSLSPTTAQGVGLSSVVKINGIRRLVSTNSQVIQRVTGVVGTELIACQVGDPNTGVRWNLPALVTIPDAGFIDVTATAVDSGTIQAAAGTLTKIFTPTRNWQSTTNTADATPGEPTESDATLRQRQSASTSLPASTVVGAMYGALKNIVGVGRLRIYENDTDATDSDGIPEHSIAAIIEGGDAETIAETIALYKTPGSGTFGTTTETVDNGGGGMIDIKFSSLTLVAMSVLVVVDAVTGYVSTTEDAIIASIVQWFSSFDIGQDSPLSKLWSPVNLTGEAATIATGQTQAQLDVLSNTYNATGLYQARPNMSLTVPTTTGNNTFHLTSVDDYVVGDKVAVALDNGEFLLTAITNIAVLVVTTAANVPAARTALTAALIYVSGDVIIDFNEATQGLADHITVQVS